MMMTPLASKHGREEDEREKWDGIVLCSCLHRFGRWLSWPAPFTFRFLAPPSLSPYSPTYLYTPIMGMASGWAVLGVCFSCPCVWYSRTWLIKRLLFRYELGKVKGCLNMRGHGYGGEMKTSFVVARVVRTGE
jgi:hypothetical protein